MSCADELTVIICSQVQSAGVVVGSTSTRCRGNGEHIWKILPKFGEQENSVCCFVLNSLVDSRGALVGNIWDDTSLL